MKPVLILVVVALLLGAGWVFVSPLFIDAQVDESFDFVLNDGSFNIDGVMAMSEEKRVGMKDDIMTAAAAMPDTAAEEAMPTQPRVLASGNFVDADAVHKGSGVASLYELPDGRHVVRFEDFRTTNGPALVVYLAKHPSPSSADDVTDGGFVNLGKLKGNVGNQNYEIPTGIDVAEYGSVVIWCELFGVLFSPAALAPTA